MAIQQAKKSWDEGGIPIGCVLVGSEGHIISKGHNQRVQLGDPTAHAEISCLRNAGRQTNWAGFTLVTTLSPCSMCSGATALFKIPRIIIGENTSFMGEEDWLKQKGVAVKVLNDPTCKQLMQQLIDEKPSLWDEDIGIPCEELTERTQKKQQPTQKQGGGDI